MMTDDASAAMTFPKIITCTLCADFGYIIEQDDELGEMVSGCHECSVRAQEADLEATQDMEFDVKLLFAELDLEVTQEIDRVWLQRRLAEPFIHVDDELLNTLAKHVTPDENFTKFFEVSYPSISSDHPWAWAVNE